MRKYIPPPQLPNILSEKSQSPVPHNSPSSPFILGQTFILQSDDIFRCDLRENAELANAADAVEFLQHRVLYEMNKMHELNLIST